MTPLSDDERAEREREASARAQFRMYELFGTMMYTSKRVAEAGRVLNDCGTVLDQLVARSVAELSPDERDHYNDLRLTDEPPFDAIVLAKRRVRGLRRATARSTGNALSSHLMFHNEQRAR